MVKSLLLFLAFTSSTQALTIECDFYLYNWVVVGYGYSCSAFITFGDNGLNSVEGVIGNHLEDFTNEDVTAILFDNQNIGQMPTNIEEFFPNIRLIRVNNANLLNISSSDLSPFPELQVFISNDNNLTVLEADLFSGVRNISWIEFYRNQITEVGEGLLNGLVLEFANFINNVCINFIAYDEQSFAELEIRLQDCIFREPTTEAPEECPDACLDIINPIVPELMRLSQTVHQYKGKFVEMSSEIEMLKGKLLANEEKNAARISELEKLIMKM